MSDNATFTAAATANAPFPHGHAKDHSRRRGLNDVEETYSS